MKGSRNERLNCSSRTTVHLLFFAMMLVLSRHATCVFASPLQRGERRRNAASALIKRIAKKRIARSNYSTRQCDGPRETLATLNGTLTERYIVNSLTHRHQRGAKS